ncbi:MAG: stage II sporulation protein M [Gemmatimonadetes bacterium]|nr:stage II sporulation protein M [Gemmatimonadota bacterium]
MAATADFRQHLEVETPEHVVIDYEIAGLGSRGLAAIIDTLIVFALMTANLLVAMKLYSTFKVVVGAWIPLAQFVVVWGYFTLFEGFRDGQTPGKKWMGLRVIRDTGHPITVREAGARNLLRIVDLLPPPYLLGILFIAFHPKGKRIGDLVAGTVVVRDRPADAPVALIEGEGDAVATGAPQLSDEDFRILREFVGRAPQLPPVVRTRLATQLAARIADRYPTRDPDHVAFVTAAWRDESARRRGRFAARIPQRATAGGEAPRGASAVMERVVARKGARWDAFGAMASRATSQGLDTLSADELPDFAARYREVAADLARARTYGADARVRLRLERLVAAGHNLLYRDDRKTWHRMWRFVAVECPAAVVSAWRIVLIAFLAFTLPALGGYAALRERPALAEEVLPAVMLERAEEGKREVAAGRGYAQAQAESRAGIASYIMTNNMRVAFACFAGGVVLGVGSLVSLAFNGLLLGAISAHFQNVGLLAYLWTFVAGHGVLELFAIWCAGAAGFLLGLAIVRPGPYSRRDALVLNARIAMRLVGTSIVLLLVAGTIEGFLSTSGAATWIKVTVSVASAVLLALYLANGARFRDEVAAIA